MEQVRLTEGIKLTLNGFQLKHKQRKNNQYSAPEEINSMAHVISEEDTTKKSERLKKKNGRTFAGLNYPQHTKRWKVRRMVFLFITTLPF